jgi:hypothetical protein
MATIKKAARILIFILLICLSAPSLNSFSTLFRKIKTQIQCNGNFLRPWTICEKLHVPMKDAGQQEDAEPPGRSYMKGPRFVVRVENSLDTKLASGN